jgi:hypothetical protein
MDKHLESAFRKIKKHDCDVWVGYLLPSEIIALVKDGAKCTSSGYVDYAIAKKARGESKSTWFYFKLGRTKPIQLTKEQRDGDLKKKYNKQCNKDLKPKTFFQRLLHTKIKKPK